MIFYQVLLCLAAAVSHLPATAEGYFNSSSNAPTHIGTRRQAVPNPDRVRIALVNVRVWNGNKILEPNTVLIDNGMIVPHISSADVVMDGLGGVLLPGFIDSHCHPESISALEDLASYGVSTALAMACSSYDVCNGLRNQVGLSQYFSSGIAAHGSGGLVPGPASIYNASQAAQYVDNVLGNGSDYLKIVAASGGPDQATKNDALVCNAHAKGRATMTHATQLFYYNQAIMSKSNGLQHSPEDFLLSPDMISLMVKQKQYVTHTMEIARIVVKIAQTDPAILAYLGENSNATYATWRSNVIGMHQAGVAILAGTDATPLIPINGSAFGWTLHEELANLVDAGLTTAEALRSATLLPALLHNFPTRGRIAFGMRADLVLLAPGANPLEEITATKNISKVWIGGLEYSDVATQPFPNVAAL